MLNFNGIRRGSNVLNASEGSTEPELRNIRYIYERDLVKPNNIASGPRKEVDRSAEASKALR